MRVKEHVVAARNEKYASIYEERGGHHHLLKRWVWPLLMSTSGSKGCPQPLPKEMGLTIPV